MSSKLIKKGGIIAALLVLAYLAYKFLFKKKNAEAAQAVKGMDTVGKVSVPESSDLVAHNFNKNHDATIKLDVLAVRSNNPGCLMYFDDWQGLDKIRSVKGKIAYFTDSTMGIRAQVKLLLSYYNKRGLKTIEQIMNRYAPSSENNTSGYIKRLSNLMKVGSTADLNLNENRANLAQLAYYIHTVEAGFAWCDYSTFYAQAQVA